MDIFESLENLNVSEECFNDMLILIEHYINEVSVDMWKRAAKNSIETRRKAKENHDFAHNVFQNGFDSNNQSKINKRYEQEDNKLSDRLERAKYLSKNLPNSEKRQARDLKDVAKKAIKSRSELSDKDRTNELENVKDGVNSSKRGMEKASAYFMEKPRKLVNSLPREDHARMLANKEIRIAKGTSSLKETPGAMKYVK